MLDKIVRLVPKAPRRIFRRKHYLAMQTVIRSYAAAAPFEAQEHCLALTNQLCDMLEKEYPEFQRKRFLRLCGLID